MNLEVGKRYFNRNQEIVKIIRQHINTLYPFVGDNGFSYTATGSFTFSSKPHPFDLIGENKEEKINTDPTTHPTQQLHNHNYQQIRTSLQKIEASVKKLEKILSPERKSKMDPCEFALAFQAWSMAIQAKLSHDLPGISVEDLAKQYGQHTTTPENLDKVSHCFDWNTVMEFIENEKETISV
jgi:hypothetical protein